MNFSDPKIFESEVRRVARALWPRAAVNGTVIIDGRERDGVFDEGEVVHIIEATTSRKKSKVEYDLEKSSDLVRKIRRQSPNKNTKIWIVTAEDPTGDQKSLISKYRKKAKCPIEICDFRSFSSKIIDAPSYIELRNNYAFGSVRNPDNDKNIEVPHDEYIPLDMLSVNTKDIFSLHDIINLLLSENNSNVVIVGDYGSGKSMTLREIFFSLAKRYLRSEISSFPVYLNLRDHFGQSNTAEALIRHGTMIGMKDPNQLVAAWRAGFVFLLLDGFDEVSSFPLVRGKEKIKSARRQAVALVHAFVDESPQKGGIVITGRQHYFDSFDELKRALGLLERDHLLSLNEFNQEQISTYLRKKGIEHHVPDWIPSRPLLLGYLVVKGLLNKGTALSEHISQEEGWDYILDRVCEREARQIDPVLIEPIALREFIERLATKARNTVSRRGPLYIREISSVFENIFDRPPDEKADTLILRLPGLTSSTEGESAREFIDDDFVDACRAGDVIRFVKDSFSAISDDLQAAAAQMGILGSRIAAYRLREKGVTEKQISASLHHATKDLKACILSVDILRIMQELRFNYIGDDIFITDGYFDELDIFEEPNLSRVYFQECYFSRIELDTNINPATSPKFSKCQIDIVSGPISFEDIPDNIFSSDTEISELSNEAQTNADILTLELPLSIRVLLTILRKLFVQSGSGRKENALYRGLDPNARAYVSDILSILQSYDFIYPNKINGPRIWMRNRAKIKEARAILQAPQTYQHVILEKVRKL